MDKEDNQQQIININRSIINKDKYHYFIGNIFRNDNQIKTLKKLQYKLKNKYLLEDCHWNNYFSSNLIYLGYFDNRTVNQYMNNIVSNLMVALSNKISTLICKYTNFRIII